MLLVLYHKNVLHHQDPKDGAKLISKLGFVSYTRKTVSFKTIKRLFEWSRKQYRLHPTKHTLTKVSIYYCYAFGFKKVSSTAGIGVYNLTTTLAEKMCSREIRPKENRDGKTVRNNIYWIYSMSTFQCFSYLKFIQEAMK